MKSDYDVCIIGTGPAGAFAANNLSKSGFRVLVIESGGDSINSDIHDNFDLINSNLKDSVNFGFSQQVGGSSNLWAGGLAEMNEVDLENRPLFNFLAWPVNFIELKILYKRVKKIIGLNNFEEVNNDYKVLLEDSNIELRDVMVMDKPFNTKELIYDDDKITLLKHHSATKISFNKDNNSVSSINVFNVKTQQHISIKADQYVLAAGSINNIRIMLHSLEHLKQSKPGFYSSIGSYFSTHPKCNIGKINLNKDLSDANPFINIFANQDGYFRYYFGLDKDTLLSNNLLNHTLRIESVYALRLSRILNFLKSSFSWMPFIAKSSYLMDLIVVYGVKFFKTLDTIRPSKSNDGSYYVQAHFDQVSKKQNRVSLSHKKSISGLPLAKVTWDYDEDDWSEVDRFMLKIKEDLFKSNIGNIEYLRPPREGLVGIHSHFIGGTRIGTMSTNSVVDSNLKVHDIDNLYISGPSVFPSFGYANPFLSIAALSLRLSDHLINILSCKSQEKRVKFD